jgi:hypothetical protein
VPSFPKRFPYAALVAVAVLLFGIAIVATKALFTAARALKKPAWSPAAAGLVRAGPQTASPTAPSAAKSVGAVSTVETVDALASELLVRPPDIGGFRTLITGETDGVDSGPEAVELARTLADAGADVMLVDWSLDGHGIAQSLGALPRPGLTELLLGEAKFEDVVARVPASSAQLIAAGGLTPPTTTSSLSAGPPRPAHCSRRSKAVSTRVSSSPTTSGGPPNCRIVRVRFLASR